MTERLPPHYGHGVCGERFWPRPALCRQVTSALQRGECVKLFGPRRTGKSSLLKECARRLREEPGAVVIEVNGEGMDAVASLFQDFVAALPAFSRDGFLTRVRALRLPEPLLQVIDRWLDRGGSSGDEVELVTRHWASLARAIADLLPSLSPRPVLLIDELAFLCEDLHGRSRTADEVKRLLGMLRDWRGAGLGMALASSIGIRQMLRRIGVPRNLLTGCTPVRVGPLEPDDAAAMLAALAAHQGIGWWSDDIAGVVLDESADLLPSCLQFAFNQLVIATETGPEPGVDAIRAVFREQIRPNFDHEFHHQFDERIGDYDVADRALAFALFRGIARSTRASRARAYADLADTVEADLGDAGRAATEGETLGELILALEDDGFLTHDRDLDQIAFASRLVEGWWRGRPQPRARTRSGSKPPRRRDPE